MKLTKEVIGKIAEEAIRIAVEANTKATSGRSVPSDEAAASVTGPVAAAIVAVAIAEAGNVSEALLKE